MTRAHIYRNCTTWDGIQLAKPDTSYADNKKVVEAAMNKAQEHADKLRSYGPQHAKLDTGRIELYHELKMMEDAE